jgi:histidinol-phosphate aminotransferase
MVKRPIRLDMNEVPTLPPANVIAAARRGLSRLNRYTDSEDVARLRALLADYAGVSEHLLVVGPGSDLLLREVVHAFGGERTVITVSPTFFPTLETVRQVATRWTGLRLSPPTFALEPEVLIDTLEGPCLVLIDNPNNPTGQVLLDRETVQAVLESEQTLLVIDEAYHEFGRVSARANAQANARANARGEEGRDNSFVDMVEDYANLAVTRTLDKAFSLAGARVGYAAVGEAFREAFVGFYAFLPQSSLYAAIAALENPGYARETVEGLVKERERLREALQDAGARVVPSHTNFLLVRSGVLDMARRLKDAGVLVSDVSNQLPPGFIRVSVGTRQENDAFLAAFREILGEDA